MSVTFLTNEDRKEMEERSILTAPQNLTDNEKVQTRANIDAIGAPQTAEVGQFIKVTEVDENGKPIAWEAGNPDWEQMENKPFHKEECVLTFLEPTDVTFDGYWVYSERIVDTVYTREELLKKVYKVVWDGVEYDNLTASVYKEDRVEIGDFDNYPFSIQVYVDNTELTIRLNDGSSTTHSVALYMYDTVITKIPDEFLPDADEEISKTSKRPVQNFAVANALENVSWNALQDKPFGEIDVEDIGYLMEPVELDFSGKNEENSLTIRALSSKVVGDTIYVSWNGECYPVVLSNGILGKHHGGNPYLYDPKAYDDTGEPFFFYTVKNNIYYVYSSEKTIVTFGIANGFFGIAKLAEEYIPATQVDFEQNDESARDYVKGRTHHKEVSSFVSPTPEYEVTNENSQFVKCGDNLPSKEDLIGALVFLDTTDGAMNYTISESDITENDWGIDFGYGYVVTSAPATIGDYTYDSTGVYLGWGLYELRTGMYRPYYRTYEMHITKYHTLDEAYIPSTIARAADVTAGLAGKVDVPQSATVGQVIAVKAVDENGVPKEWECVDLPEGFSGSWNDLEDKPFGKETTISQIIEPTDLTFKTKYTGEDSDEYYTESLTFDGTAWMDQFKKGDIAVVVVDGVKYTAVVEPFKRWMRAYVQDEDGDLLYELSFPVTDVQDTIIISPYCFQTVGEHTVNFSLRKESTVITPISEEYLPSAVILGIDSENYLISIETGERITTAQLRAMYEAGTTVYVQFKMWHMAVLSYVFISAYAYVTCGKVSGTTMEFVNYYTAEYTA